VTQNWDKKLSAMDGGDPCNSSRFTCVLDGAGVRDTKSEGLTLLDAATLKAWARAYDMVLNWNEAGTAVLTVIEPIISYGEQEQHPAHRRGQNPASALTAEFETRDLMPF
jgi:hypothetical protein